MVRRILGSNTEKVTEDLRKLHKEFQNFYFTYNPYGGWSVSEKLKMHSILTRLISGKGTITLHNRMLFILFNNLRVAVNGGFL